jgi:signal transduction histidine kinase
MRDNDVTPQSNWEEEKAVIEKRLILIGVLQELTEAVMDLFDPKTAMDDFLDRLAARLGCFAVLLLEAADGTQPRLLGASGLSSDSRKLPLAPGSSLKKSQDGTLQIDWDSVPLPYPELTYSELRRWTFGFKDASERDRSEYVLCLFFNDDVRLLMHYRGMVEHLTHILLTALLHRRLYERVLQTNHSLESHMRQLKETQDQLLEKNRELSEANQRIERSKTELESFVYTVSHDLKTPVISFHGMASILMENYAEKLDEQGRHYLQRLIANASFMEKLIADLLELSRIGRRERQLERIQTEKIVAAVLDQCDEVMQRRKIEVRVLSPLPDIFFDRTLLMQVFLNLISNALKFMGDQSRPKIEIGGREEEKFAEFYVKDNGIGIDSQYHDQVFGVFQRLKDIDVEGSGVGLSIVKKIVELAGGKVWVESKKGGGAAFFFRLPR